MNGDVVMAALGAVRNGDLSKASELVSDDFVWHIPGTSSISGDAAGVEEWSTKLQRLLAAGLQPELVELLVGDGHVAAVQRNTATSGEHSLDVRVVNLFTLEEGRIVRLETFFGDQPAAEAFWNAVL